MAENDLQSRPFAYFAQFGKSVGDNEHWVNIKLVVSPQGQNGVSFQFRHGPALTPPA